MGGDCCCRPFIHIFAMIYQISTAISGIDIIWASGSGLNTAGGYTAADIDNEIAYNGVSSIEETHRTLFNQWLSTCKVLTDAGGEAETTQQQALIKRSFKLLCYYAYSKDGFMQDLANGKCDCDCEQKKKQYLKQLSEDVICKTITNACMKEKYLDWLHGKCDTKTSLSSFLSSDVVTNDCTDYYIRRHGNTNDCGCCGS